MSDFDIRALEPVEVFEAPIYLKFHYIAGRTITRFLRAVKRGELIGGLSPATGKVLVPTIGACPESGKPTGEEVRLRDVGTVLGFTTVHLPIPASSLKPPFVVANILLDGADQTISHLVAECDPTAVKIGQRVQAKWKPQTEWDYGLDNILYFTLLNEPLVDVDVLRETCLIRAEERRHA